MKTLSYKMKINPNIKQKIMLLLLTWILTAIGLILFKYIPMYIYGNEILYDASSHMAWAGFGLYFLWTLFIENKKRLKIPYFIFSSIILIFMGIQRILAEQHNLIGVLLGLSVSAIAIIVPRIHK